jgi:hypothetical protein
MFTSISVGGSGTSTIVIGQHQGERVDPATLRRLGRLGAAGAVEAACGCAHRVSSTTR